MMILMIPTMCLCPIPSEPNLKVYFFHFCRTKLCCGFSSCLGEETRTGSAAPLHVATVMWGEPAVSCEDVQCARVAIYRGEGTCGSNATLTQQQERCATLQWVCVSCVCVCACTGSYLQVIQGAGQAEAFGPSEGAPGRGALRKRREAHGQTAKPSSLRTQHTHKHRHT